MFCERQLFVRLELRSQVPSTPFLHERDASVRGFPDDVCTAVVCCREDRLPTTTAQILCRQECFADVHDSESDQQFHNIVLHVFGFQTQDSGSKLMQFATTSCNVVTSTHAELRLMQWIRVCTDVHRKTTHFCT